MQIVVEDICSNSVYVEAPESSAIPSQDYTIGNSQINIYYSAFIVDPEYCPLDTHFSIDPALDNTTDPNAINIDTKIRLVTIYSEALEMSIDPATMIPPATYTVQIWLRTETGVDFKNASELIEFEITMSDLCSSTSITLDLTTGVLPSNPSLFAYQIGQSS